MTRSDVGRKAKASGDRWESWVETQHEKAKHLGILAHVTHTEPKTNFIGGRLIYVEKSVADYVGCLEDPNIDVPKSAWYLAVEAKSTVASSFYKKEVSPKQQDHLERVSRAGGLALLLIEFIVPVEASYVFRRRFAVPWLTINWQVKRTAESISADDLVGWEVHPECYLKRWHPGGQPSTPVKVKRYARE